MQPILLLYFLMYKRTILLLRTAYYLFDLADFVIIDLYVIVISYLAIVVFNLFVTCFFSVVISFWNF